MLNGRYHATNCPIEYDYTRMAETRARPVRCVRIIGQRIIYSLTISLIKSGSEKDVRRSDRSLVGEFLFS